MVPENGTNPQAEQSRPVTRFQKVASALRGDKTDEETGPPTIPDPEPPDGGEASTSRDYWDDASSGPGAGPGAGSAGDHPVAAGDHPVAVTQPDGLGTASAEPDGSAGPAKSAGPAEAEEPADSQAGDHATTLPDMFGTTARPDPGETSGAYQDQTAAQGPVEASGAVEAPGPVGDSGPVADSGPAAASGPGEGPLRPGQAAGVIGDFSDLAYGNLIPEAAEFRTRWQQIQFKFVDDPQASVTEAADVVAQVSTRLEAAIQERQRIIQEHQRTLRDRWSEGANADTEALRETLRMYRGFLDQLLGTAWGQGGSR